MLRVYLEVYVPVWDFEVNVLNVCFECQSEFPAADWRLETDSTKSQWGWVLYQLGFIWSKGGNPVNYQGDTDDWTGSNHQCSLAYEFCDVVGGGGRDLGWCIRFHGDSEMVCLDKKKWNLLQDIMIYYSPAGTELLEKKSQKCIVRQEWWRNKGSYRYSISAPVNAVGCRTILYTDICTFLRSHWSLNLYNYTV